jgi:hypothetical protein
MMSRVDPAGSERYAALMVAAVDRVTVRIAGALGDAGVQPIVLKGPTFARWLYPDGLRVYGDADLLVNPVHWGHALSVLRALGFTDSLSEMAHPRMQSQRSWALSRGFEQVDMHATLSGLDAPPEVVWRALHRHAETILLDGEPVLALGETARTMHVALHAAHHPGANKFREDLRRALEVVPPGTWAAARDLALELGGGPAFAAGLRALPESSALARALDVGSLRSVQGELRSAGVPVAEALDELLTTPGVRPRLRMLRSELLPNRAFMRWNHGLSRRGRLALAASYPLRWMALTARLPRAAMALVRARRRTDHGRPTSTH